jgi:predicted nucleic acid-binding protein
MEHLVDTNMLLRWSQPDHRDYATVRLAIENLAADHELCVSTQNLVEFWNVATRPTGANGFGLDPQSAALELAELEGFFKLLPDEPAVYRRWRRLVVDYGVSGAKAYDARLVAVMLVHGVRHVLTFNKADFARYTGITALDPSDVLAQYPSTS